VILESFHRQKKGKIAIFLLYLVFLNV
jgi:hypothetical protein